jgi:hypothetical protein
VTRLRLVVALSAAVLTIGVAAPARAQTSKLPRRAKESAAQPAAGKPAEKPAAGEAAEKGDRKTAGRKVVRLEEMRVEGRVQKPQALFLMPRANVNNSGDQDRIESFLSKATDAVKTDPF